MATQMLHSRLAAVRAARRADPSIQDETPTLLDIERTHILFTNAHFKPFVAIGYEYNKVMTTAGSVTFGSDIQFSIPQFGDFFNDMVLYVKLGAPTYTTTESNAGDMPALRWCDFPGERLIKSAAFEVNGNPLDQYTREAMVMHRNFNIQPNKRLAWDRCVGQERPKTGYLIQSSGDLPDQHRVVLQATDGAQTPKQSQSGLSLFIPLLFWCCKDPRLAVPSVSIPFGQRYINISLAERREIVDFITRGDGTRSKTNVSNPAVESIVLYINNIFVNPEIHNIYIRRIGFTLIRVHRQQIINVNSSTTNSLLQNLKWPIESLFVGLRPIHQKSQPSTGPNADKNVEGPLRDWHKFSSVEEVSYNLPGVARPDSVDDTKVDGVASGVFLKHNKTLTSLSIEAHGVNLYKDMPSDFFGAYIPYTFGGANINAPEDEGVLMVPFNLYPGTYQPSGHVNVSRAREFYINITSNEVSSDKPGELIVIASAINFLLISDGSAVLRYST